MTSTIKTVVDAGAVNKNAFTTPRPYSNPPRAVSMKENSSHQNKFRPLLILVHPGSLCGSADMNLSDEADAAREAVIDELNGWSGNILVLDGWLSDELGLYPLLDRAIQDAISRSPMLADRLEADDPEHTEIALSHLAELGVPLSTPISLTGAWYEPDYNSGCVLATQQGLLEAGYTNVTVMQSAAVL